MVGLGSSAARRQPSSQAGLDVFVSNCSVLVTRLTTLFNAVA